jgi:hypothetical protein
VRDDVERSVTPRRVARALGIRLTKAKLAEAVPYAGALVGGGFNVYFTNKVCAAA